MTTHELLEAILYELRELNAMLQAPHESEQCSIPSDPFGGSTRNMRSSPAWETMRAEAIAKGTLRIYPDGTEIIDMRSHYNVDKI